MRDPYEPECDREHEGRCEPDPSDIDDWEFHFYRDEEPINK